ncbi:MAG TPA: threonylcarbamoyl-AMP synthase [Persephonella sp.]|uniref:L-threonylcarbamoyladenylate synthase n=1 Tax=Persephonella marina (strain DSM 14350 / EX-H1) TaxID=123214 RepID=C0QS03_PERMH|nr:MULTISPECIES: L-threonylcarbamoyladenylate synthase [Persephonella]ACO04858.1 Sua5/YciO/YrdC/YwlC family protein [Persephonella marina EX-H1]HCB69194.1 threonylcarbamoyl-AMP synthase [Persephonella sp.]
MTDIKVSKNIEEAAEYLKKGRIVIAPTDTLYGILADALNKDAVEKVYRLKGRTPTKPVIVLIPQLEFLDLFCVKPSEREKKLLIHRGITVVIDLQDDCKERFFYLHRGKGSLGFRIPDSDQLIKVMERIERPLIAPSANPEGKKPAEDIDQAVSYFGSKVDLYIDGGTVKGKEPSTVVKIDNGITVIREGSIKKDEIKRLLEG